MIEIRKQNPAFGLGTFTELQSSNPAVLAFLREYKDDLVLCVHNFSRFAQPTELDLREFDGRHPVELIGGVRFPAIGELPSSNPAVLAFLREYEDDLVLCVNNFSRFAQPTELDLSAFEGRHPVELFGGVRFPAVGELPYLMTLGGHGFYWFRLRKDTA
jgi:glycosidase